MPKSKGSVVSRLREYPNEGFIQENGKLFCKLCLTEVDFEKKSVIVAHTKSIKHQKGKENERQSTSVQMTMPQAVYKKVNVENKWSSLVSALTSCGIPVHVLSNPELRQWMKSYVKEGENMPSETTFRKYLTEEGIKDHEESINIFKEEAIALQVDETIDIKNRKVINVLALPLGNPYIRKCRLVKTIFVETCNADMIVELVLSTLEYIKVPRSKLLAFISDNAPYMRAAGLRLQAVCIGMLVSSCWAHILHLQAEEVRAQFKTLDRFVAATKASLCKAPSRRQALKLCLQAAGKPAQLPPVPVITRWGTWLQAVSYHVTNFEEEKTWISQEREDSAAICELKNLIDSSHLSADLLKISTVAKELPKVIKTLEQREILSANIWHLLETVRILLASNTISCSKVSAYMEGRHPNVQFWKDVRCLDPNQANETSFINLELPRELLRFSQVEVPKSEIASYVSLLQESNNVKDVLGFWGKNSGLMPILSKLALRALTVPATSAEVERTFSTLKNVLTSQRLSLTEENLDVHMRMAFNRGYRKKNSAASENSDVSDVE